MEPDGVDEWTGPLAPRLLAMLVPLGMLFVALVQSTLISQAGVHLCHWPATISCDRGVRFVWPALGLAGWVLAGVACVDWALFAIRRSRAAGRRLLGWLAWGPSVGLCTLLAVEGGRIDGVDLVLGMTVVVSALWLLARTIAGWTRLSERAVLALLSPMIAGALLAPVWGPSAFRAAARAEESAGPGPGELMELPERRIDPYED